MEQYDQTHGCPKCGTLGAAGVKYHKANDANCHLGNSDKQVEHMHRSCNICGYTWAEAPLS